MTPGVWYCSYVFRIKSGGTAQLSFFNAYMTVATTIANVTPLILGFSSISYFPGTITISNAPTGAGAPIVFASLNATTSLNPYFINVVPTGTNTFNYFKTFYNTAAGSVSSAIASASGETFNYIAIWL